MQIPGLTPHDLHDTPVTKEKDNFSATFLSGAEARESFRPARSILPIIYAEIWTVFVIFAFALIVFSPSLAKWSVEDPVSYCDSCDKTSYARELTTSENPNLKHR